MLIWVKTFHCETFLWPPKIKDPHWFIIPKGIQLRRACIAIRMGYHRDPQHFKSLSPYQGEMRRRMWAMIYSLDIGFASQMGLPGSIKHSLSDTMPPRNLQDRDFDASSTELPPTRPIDELTSSTVILAKLHVAVSLGVISDKVCSPHQLSHEDLIAAISTLDNMYETIPEPCKFRPISESLLDPPSVLFQVSAMALPQKRNLAPRSKFQIPLKHVGGTKEVRERNREGDY